MLACCAVAASSYAQDVPVNREKYPDYVDPQKAYPSEPRLMKFVPVEGESASRAAARKSAAEKLPDHWNNADTKYFPPVFNQAGGSCGSASRIGYMFTHEINALRDADASLPENQYPTHFVWLLTNGNSGKDAFVEYVGVPNAKVYGGQTYSSQFGYQEEVNNYFGWMTGYDKWMNAIGNRMLRPTSNPLTLDTEEGRLAAKAWLYNHAGDPDFKAGGLIGLGVASGGQWSNIPATKANDAAGVTGKYFVHRWGTQVDHAVTMVGWDDRIEFDLNKDGKFAEDEKGAWIIVNSWGNWCNDGFIYCPYKYAGPVSDPTTGEMRNGYWSGELYHARKNFRPLRVIKLKMDYTHRSEMLLQVGISTDLNATEPEAVMDMHHFRYAGDGANGDADPAPIMPMLGKWADNKYHEEPMEFCYDVTDFSAGFDQNKPLKYFFIINRKKDTSRGSGNVYLASIVDMDKDVEGIETPFDLGGEKFTITKEGKQLMISTVVYGNGYEPVNNLAYVDGKLSWSAPNLSSYEVEAYNIYKDADMVATTKELAYAIDGGSEYGVTVLYTDGTESAKKICTSGVKQNELASSFQNAGFTIPNVFSRKFKECTLEFFIKPTEFKNWNCAAGPGWGSYMHHLNQNGTFTFGWDTSARLTTEQPFSLDKWQHVTIVVKNNKMTMYKNGVSVGTISTQNYSGLGGFGDLVFTSSGNNAQNASYDEIRIWDHARTAQQIKGGTSYRRQEFHGDVMPQGLVAYYKGDTFLGADGKYYMRDCVGGNHATIQASGNPQVEDTPENLKNNAIKAAIKVDSVKSATINIPITLTATYSERVNKIWWSVPSCGISNLHVLSPVVTFTEMGTHTVAVYGETYNGDTLSHEMQVEVQAAPALDASFTSNAVVLPCGEHFSFIANKFSESCKYEWSLPGVDVETVYGAKAGATYTEIGEYTVTLKITSADGSTAESSMTVSTTASAPKADFMVAERIVLKETPATLISTSRYAPTEYQWVLQGEANKVTIKEACQEQVWVPKYPGKYDITLKASNAMGDNSITKNEALIVTNDDSKSGLFFSNANAKVNIPVVKELQEFTIDFWANPTSLENDCWGIGDEENKLFVKFLPTGIMSVTINGVTSLSPKDFILENQWNHYAIRRNSAGVLVLFRNSEKIATINTDINKDVIKLDKGIALGAGGAPMNGGIDEFRLWGKSIGFIEDICNKHMNKPEEYVASDTLMVYYDFNQNSGDVIDRSGNGNHGVRTGFGPDGDSWPLSKGVFSLYLGSKKSNETITSVEEHWQDEPVAAGRKGVYTLSGQYVGKTVKGLPSGLYIVDGQKISVK